MISVARAYWCSRIAIASGGSTSGWRFKGSCNFLTKAMDKDSSGGTYKFGPWPIEPSEVFAESKHCFAFVNLKPILPGHVLVSTKRVVPRFTSLESEEVADLWTLAQEVGQKLERFHKATSLTLTIQDGPEAGQTVPHVHIHILPRKEGDFENNDEIYDAIDQASEDGVKQLKGASSGAERKKNLDEDRKPRTREEMSEEAGLYRSSFGEGCRLHL
eukprot:jgi/Picsp_1/587/NSC_00584-R1_bis(5 -adenosyl)-triphosphatase